MGVIINLSNQTEAFIVTGGTSADTITTGNGADTITGGNGADIISAGGGIDTINGFVGADTVDGGAQTDTIVLTGTSADLNAAANGDIVNVEAVSAAGAAGSVTIDLHLQTEGFTITGGTSADTITGGAGVDSISAGAGNDFINGFVGADTVDGGTNTDTIFLDATSTDLNAAINTQIVNVEEVNASGASADVTVDLHLQTEGFIITGSAFNDIITGGAAANAITAGAGNDTVTGGAGNDTLFGSGDDDVLEGLGGNDTINGGTGNDTVSYANAAAGVTVDLALTTQQNTVGAGLDTITLTENLTGSGFADTLHGSSIDNTLTGGAGNDAFIFNTGDAHDTIADFDAGASVSDVLDLRTWGFGDFSEVTDLATDVGADMTINFGGGNTLTLIGVNKADLVANDFLLA